MIPNQLFNEAKKRNKKFKIALVGCGWFGSGLYKELLRFDFFEVPIIFNRSTERARNILRKNGIPEEKITIAQTSQEIKEAREKGQITISSNLSLIKDLEDIDLIFESTGSLLAGTESALFSFDAGIDFLTVNSEMDATVGLILAKKAREAGVLYSNVDGDQPGVLARMIEEVKLFGFKPKVVGSCKGFLDEHQNPKGVMPFVPKGQDPVKICSFADGSKQSFESVVIGNAYAMDILKEGMIGPKVPSRHDIVSHFAKENLLDENCYVDFVMGINGTDQGAGVFVLAHREGEEEQYDLKYLKKGEGPLYLFFRDHHLCYFEVPLTILQALLYKTPLLVPRTWTLDVATYAKRDLQAGQKLDDIGGFDCYGRIQKNTILQQENTLPMGLIPFATLKEDLAQDEPISYDKVELEENVLVMLRREQDELLKKGEIK